MPMIGFFHSASPGGYAFYVTTFRNGLKEAATSRAETSQSNVRGPKANSKREGLHAISKRRICVGGDLSNRDLWHGPWSGYFANEFAPQSVPFHRELGATTARPHLGLNQRNRDRSRRK